MATNILSRFYDPEAGEVLVGGQDIKTVSQTSLRSSIGVVPQVTIGMDADDADPPIQDTVLFNESIQFNISYGRIGASLADVQEVAALADIHTKVSIHHASLQDWLHCCSPIQFRLCPYRTAMTQKWGNVD